jgi:hypothetical protein
MLNDPPLKIIRVPRVIGVVGATQYINPKTHSLILSALRQAQGERNLRQIVAFGVSAVER